MLKRGVAALHGAGAKSFDRGAKAKLGDLAVDVEVVERERNLLISDQAILARLRFVPLQSILRECSDWPLGENSVGTQEGCIGT